MHEVTRLRGLLLDLDGTIADTLEIIYHCYDDILREHAGIDFPRASWDHYAGLPLSDTFELALADQGVRNVAVERLVECYRALLREREDQVRAFPGIVETLRELRRRGIKLGIVTTKFTSTANRHLHTMGITDLFDVLIGGDQCPACKPDPEPFRRGLAGLGLEAQEVAGVGDSRFDVEGSRAAGLLAVAATWGTTNREALIAAGPDRVIAHPEELLELTG